MSEKKKKTVKIELDLQTVAEALVSEARAMLNFGGVANWDAHVKLMGGKGAMVTFTEPDPAPSEPTPDPAVEEPAPTPTASGGETDAGSNSGGSAGEPAGTNPDVSGGTVEGPATGGN